MMQSMALAFLGDLTILAVKARSHLVDRITESLLNEFTTEYGLAALPEDTRFEHFAGYITVRRQHTETFDSADIATGSGNGTGIDAIAIIVNG